MSVTDCVVVVPPGADGRLQHGISPSRHSFRARRLLPAGEPSVAQDHSAGAPGDLRCHQGPERAGRPGDHHTVSRAAPTGKLLCWCQSCWRLFCDCCQCGERSGAQGPLEQTVQDPVSRTQEEGENMVATIKRHSAGFLKHLSTKAALHSLLILYNKTIFLPRWNFSLSVFYWATNECMSNCQHFNSRYESCRFCSILTHCCLVCSQLCFALSMIGNPQIVLLDEPSSGMDPKSKQRMWWDSTHGKKICCLTFLHFIVSIIKI